MGLTLPVTARNTYHGVRALTVSLPDGAALSIPEWMTRSDAATFTLQNSPVLPARALRDLRITLDIILSLPSDESASGGSYGATTCLRSTDSDPTEATRLQLRATERNLLVQLVQSLLLEIVFNRTTDTSVRQ